MSLLALTPQTQDLYGLDYTQNTNPHTRVHTKPTTPYTGSPRNIIPKLTIQNRVRERNREKKNSRGRESQNPPPLLVETLVVSGGKRSSSFYSWPWSFGEREKETVREREREKEWRLEKKRRKRWVGLG